MPTKADWSDPVHILEYPGSQRFDENYSFKKISLMARWVLTDLHGCLRTFDALLDRLELTEGDSLYFLGDYVDRGPDSKGVIDRIWELEKHYTVHCLRGNHEETVLRFNRLFGHRDIWAKYLNTPFWYSFGKPARLEDVDPHYFTWMNSLPHYLLVDEYILVHAGVNFALENPLSNPTDLMWMRNWYDKVDYEWLGERYLLHGHVPVVERELWEQYDYLERGRILCLDGGTPNAHLEGFGYMSAFDLDTWELLTQASVEHEWVLAV